MTEAVKETLVGTIREPELSSHTKATFNRHAKRDEGSEELYMTEAEFVNAIAPETEDYVSSLALCAQELGRRNCTLSFEVF